jgi:hypothetical protein
VAIAGSIWSTLGVKLPVIFTTGLILAGMIWKVSEMVEGVLSADTKLRIAVWLLDQKPVSNMIQRWPDTFRDVFIAIFGKRFLSWKCFLRSCIYSACASLIVSALICFDSYPMFAAFALPQWRNGVFAVGITTIVIFTINVLPDYLSLGETRFILWVLKPRRGFWFVVFVLVCDLGFSLVFPYFIGKSLILWDPFLPFPLNRMVMSVGESLLFEMYKDYRLGLSAVPVDPNVALVTHLPRVVWSYPSVLMSAWIWLYVLAGIFIKLGRRFDLGFAWFNKHMNIEEKPLQSIGIVLGGIVAVICWVGLTIMGKMPS